MARRIARGAQDSGERRLGLWACARVTAREALRKDADLRGVCLGGACLDSGPPGGAARQGAMTADGQRDAARVLVDPLTAAPQEMNSQSLLRRRIRDNMPEINPATARAAQAALLRGEIAT